MAPYACCKHTCATCFENYIPRTDNSRIPYLTLSQINTDGCLPLFTNKMWEILYVLIGLVLIAFKLDVRLPPQIVHNGFFLYFITSFSSSFAVWRNISYESKRKSTVAFATMMPAMTTRDVRWWLWCVSTYYLFCFCFCCSQGAYFHIFLLS